jgi:tetratricopeptide (TPR) repeat protein
MPQTTLRQKILLIAGSVFFVLVLLELLMRGGGATFFFLQDMRNRASLEAKDAYRILCIGESTTAWGGNDSYPSQLERILKKENPGRQFSVINKGMTSKTTEDILAQLPTYLSKYRPDMVVAMMGINDRGEWVYDNYDPEGGAIKKALRKLRLYKLGRFIYLHCHDKLKNFNARISHQKGQTAAGNPAASFSCGELENDLEKFPSPDPLTAELAYVNLTSCYLGIRECDQAQRIFEAHLTQIPQADVLYNNIGWCRHSMDDFVKAEEMYMNAIRLNPHSVIYYSALGRNYCLQDRYPEAEIAFAKALQEDPQDAIAYYDQGCCYERQKQFEKAETSLRRALEIDGHNFVYILLLAEIYQAEKKYDQAEKFFDEALKMNPEDSELLYAVVDFNKERGRADLANLYLQKANALETQYYLPVTRKNYRKLAELVRQKKIALVAVQYPRREMIPLRNMLAGVENVIFVDNQKIFDDAVISDGYEVYFRDTFSGNFGHCTAKGNRLLAENIAKTIVKEIKGDSHFF